jgi:hypothetical protein
MVSTTRDGRVRTQYHAVRSASRTATNTSPATTNQTRRLSSATRLDGDAVAFGAVVAAMVVEPFSRFAVVAEGPEDPPPGVVVDELTCWRTAGLASAAGGVPVEIDKTAQRTMAGTAELSVHLVLTPSLPGRSANR